MTKSIFLFAAVLYFLFACQPQNKKLVIKGKVFTEENTTPVMAHVRLLVPGLVPDVYDKTVRVESNGTFKMEIDSATYMRIMVSAVNHHPLYIPIYTDTVPGDISLDVRLKHYDYYPEFEDVRITGGWNKFEFSTAIPMQKQDDGTFVTTIEPSADTVAYELLGITQDMRSVNGTMSDRFHLDGGGDYMSVIHAKADLVKIIFDPALLKRSKLDEPVVRFSPPYTHLNKLIEIDRYVEKEQQRYRKEARAYRQRKKSLDGFAFNGDSLKNYLINLSQSAQPPVNKYAFFKLAEMSLFMIPLDSLTCRTILASIPINDPIWESNPMIFPFIYLYKLNDSDGLKTILPQIKSRLVAGNVIANLGMKAYYEGDKKTADEYYKQLKEGYADIPSLKHYIKRLNPDKKVAVGKPLPRFSIRLMDSDQTISNKELRGKYTLIDFWAVWCSPCVGEMPSLHAAYKKFKSPRFNILSLSFDGKEDDVRKFRKEQWPMPWLHAFVKGGFRSKLANEFEVMGIPKPILVDPNGIIVAMEGDLRGENLEKILKKYLK